MADIASVVSEAREYLANKDPHSARKTLSSLGQEADNDIQAVQALAECHLELSSLPDEPNGDQHAELAYNYFTRAADLDDARGSRGGYEKYLWLGQFSGGHDAIKWFRRACDGLRTELSIDQTTDIGKAILRKKLCDALCSSIEIWMTDLCMEPEAESSCEALIAESLMVDADHQDSYSTLASIRISQQRLDDAREAIQRSWELYCAMSYATDENQISDDDGFDEVAQIMTLKTLARLSIETEMYDIAEKASLRMTDLDEDVIEAWYLLGLAYYQQFFKNHKRKTLSLANEAFNTASELLEVDASSLDDPEEMLNEVRRYVNEIDTLMAQEKSDAMDDDDKNENDESEWLDILDDEEDQDE
ncbi:hypothetical protein V1511DRAFT_460666 [Dipodascopsis uninucleata]